MNNSAFVKVSSEAVCFSSDSWTSCSRSTSTSRACSSSRWSERRWMPRAPGWLRWRRGNGKRLIWTWTWSCGLLTSRPRGADRELVLLELRRSGCSRFWPPSVWFSQFRAQHNHLGPPRGTDYSPVLRPDGRRPDHHAGLQQRRRTLQSLAAGGTGPHRRWAGSPDCIYPGFNSVGSYFSPFSGLDHWETKKKIRFILIFYNKTLNKGWKLTWLQRKSV